MKNAPDSTPKATLAWVRERLIECAQTCERDSDRIQALRALLDCTEREARIGGVLDDEESERLSEELSKQLVGLRRAK